MLLSRFKLDIKNIVLSFAFLKHSEILFVYEKLRPNTILKGNVNRTANFHYLPFVTVYLLQKAVISGILILYKILMNQ